MKDLRFSLSSILLAALIVPVIMTYSIYPGDTNYLQFGLIFVLLLGNFILDIANISSRTYKILKILVTFLTLILAVGGVFLSAVVTRHVVAPVFEVHDIVLQQEAAIRFLLQGINPYKATYFGTFLESFNYGNGINPALYHFVMQPLYLVFALPFYAVSIKTLGYFDGRIPLYFLYAVSLFTGFFAVKGLEKKLLFVVVLGLNPAMFLYLKEGRSDFFMYPFFLLSMFFLVRKKDIISSVFLALAFAVKQSIWPIFPLYFAFMWFRHKKIKSLTMPLVYFAITFLIFVIPFFIWDPAAFLNSTVFYLSGNTEHAYPISGYGAGVLMHQLGIIKSLDEKFPFIILQIIFVTPIFVYLLKLLRKYTTVKMLIFTYGIAIFVFWYFSRYFNNSHLAYITMIFITAYFWPDEKSNA